MSFTAAGFIVAQSTRRESEGEDSMVDQLLMLKNTYVKNIVSISIMYDKTAASHLFGKTSAAVVRSTFTALFKSNSESKRLNQIMNSMPP